MDHLTYLKEMRNKDPADDKIFKLSDLVQSSTDHIYKQAEK
jgi:hypothetical protein